MAQNLAFKQSRYLNNGSGQYSKETLFKNYNNSIIGAPQSSQNMQNPQNALSKSTLQSLEKLRNVRSLTPDKQQFLLNPQAALLKAQQYQINQTPQPVVSNNNLIQQQSPQSNRSNANNNPKSLGGSANQSKLGSKKYSIAGGNNTTKLNSSRVSNSKSMGPTGLLNTQQFQGSQSIQQQQIFNLTQRNPNLDNNINANNSIDNLSTLRSSDVNEREKNLLEKIKHYKKENHQLIQLLKESEQMVSDKIQKQKKETDQILQILNKLWPLMQRIVQMDNKSIDQATKNVLITLGEILGKDTTMMETSQSSYRDQNSVNIANTNEILILRKENDFLKGEAARLKSDIQNMKKKLSLSNIKSDLILQEFSKNIDQADRIHDTLSLKCQQASDIIPSISKIQSLETQICDTIMETQLRHEQVSIIQLLEKLEQFELEYFNQNDTDLSRQDMSPPPKKSENLLFDTEITLLNNNSYLIKAGQGSALQKQINSQQQPQITNSNAPTQRKGGAANNTSHFQQQPMGENTNVSLPDISSTEIAPNKFNAPSKIININHVRGLQFYQKQLGRNGEHSQIEELGTSVIDSSQISNKISVSNNLAILRNRSTSPSILPKKNLIKKDI